MLRRQRPSHRARQQTRRFTPMRHRHRLHPAAHRPVSRKSPPPQDKVTLLKEILQANDADIVFYGRLEDQSGSAVSGAAVNFSIQYENPNARGIQRGQVVSDGNGFFTISGYKGANLTIMPKKRAMRWPRPARSFRYSQISAGVFCT